MEKIPFLDFGQLNSEYRQELLQAFAAVVDSGRYILGPRVQEFEAAFAQFTGVRHAIGVGNGFDALCLIFAGHKALGVLKEGDEVLVPSNTYIATILAITHSRLVPVLVEPEMESFLLEDVRKMRASLTPHTRAVLPVHLYGQIAHSAQMTEFARENGLLVVEDASQAHGAMLEGKRCGSLGNAAAFSLYPSKPLGAVGGDAGIVTTSDDGLADAIRSLRNYGSDRKYENRLKGVNSRLDELQAAMLLAKLEKLDATNARRRAFAECYLDKIDNPLLALPRAADAGSHVWHLFAVRTAERERFRKHLDDRGIETMIHYPIPPHRQLAYKEWDHLSFPISEEIHRTVVSIPLHHMLTDAQVAEIIRACNSFS